MTQMMEEKVTTNFLTRGRVIFLTFIFRKRWTNSGRHFSNKKMEYFSPIWVVLETTQTVSRKVGQFTHTVYTVAKPLPAFLKQTSIEVSPRQLALWDYMLMVMNNNISLGNHLTFFWVPFCV